MSALKLDKVIAVRNNKTVYRDGEYAIKLFGEDFCKADILNEALNQARAEDTGLNVPKIMEITKVDGKWAIVYEFIEGKTLARMMEEAPDKKEEYLSRMVDIQLEMHGKSSPLMTKLWDKMNRKIQQTDLDASTRYDLHTRLAGMPKHHKLCHGDFNPSNIIITPDDKAYILDWSHATQGNASADAARTHLLFWLDGDIDGAKRYLQLFCQKSDTAIQYVQGWLPIVAASQSVKGNAKEREFLLSWVNVVDYE